MPFWYFNELNNSMYRLDEQLYTHVRTRMAAGFEAGRHERAAIKTKEQLAEYNKRQRKLFVDAIGGVPTDDTPLNAKVCSKFELDGIKCENIMFNSRKDTYVTATMYIPEGITMPAPAVLFVCGHNKEGRLSDRYRRVCHILAKSGVIVFSMDPPGQGERCEYVEADGSAKISGASTEHDQAGVPAVATGKYIARYFLADQMRAVDYMLTRPEIDGDRIGVTGNSGGGTQSSVMMFLDDRIKAAAPGTFISSKEHIMWTASAQDSEQCWPGSVTNGLEHVSLFMAFAPKPALILGARHDFFPIEGAYETVDEGKRFYEMMGRPDGLELFVDDIPHVYSDLHAVRAGEFFTRELCGAPVTVDLSEIKDFPPEVMFCTEHGNVRRDVPGARFLYDEGIDTAKVQREARLALPEEERAARREAWLREKLFAGRTPTDRGYFKWVDVNGEHEDGLKCGSAIWRSQKDFVGRASIIVPEDVDFKENRPTIIAVWDGGTRAIDKYEDYVKAKCAEGYRIFVVDVTGVGHLTQNEISGYPQKAGRRDASIFTFAYDLIACDDSIPALRAYEVLRAISVLESDIGLDIANTTLFCDGMVGTAAVMAAALEKRIKVEYGDKLVTSVEDFKIKDIFHTYDDDMSIMFPGMLEYFDYGELMR